MLSRFRAAGLLWPTLCLIPALALLLGLGTWQRYRLTWKTELIGAIAERAKLPPLPHAEALKLRCNMADDGLAQSCNYRRIRVRGVFDHANEKHVFAGAQDVNGRTDVGYWVFTPFLPDGPNPYGPAVPMQPIFVNRGFVPENFKSSSSRIQGQFAGPTEISAQIRTRQMRDWFDGSNDSQKNVYYVRDPRELGLWYGKQVPSVFVLTAGWFYLEVVDQPSFSEFPKPLISGVRIPNRHLEYAFTWWAFAVSLLGVYLVFARGRLAAERS